MNEEKQEPEKIDVRLLSKQPSFLAYLLFTVFPRPNRTEGNEGNEAKYSGTDGG